MLKQYKHLDEILPKHERVVDATTNRMSHMTYPHDSMETLKIQHFKPERFSDWLAFWTIQWMITVVNLFSGYYFGPMTESKWVARSLLIETVSVIPGTVGSICRYLRSLRLMKKDKGWIHHMIEEADNQRFHLFTFLSLSQPGIVSRLFIVLKQAAFTVVFFISYLISPRFCHKFVGYLEEAAYRNYSMILQDIDRKGGALNHWKTKPASQQAIDYYRFDSGACFREVILAIRADQVCHQESNHFFAQVDNNMDLQAEKVRIYHDKNQARLKNSL